MSTVREALDRMFREWLEPADEQPARFTLADALTISASTFEVNGAFLSPEEEDLFGPGTVVEIGQEWVQIGTYDGDSNVAADCKRGVGGTTPAAHDSGDEGKIGPKYSRRAAFDAFCDEIVGLYPKLWAVTESESMTFSSSTITEVPATVMFPMYAWMRPVGSTAASAWDRYDVKWLDHFPGSTTGKAVASTCDGTGYLVYKAKFPRPADEDTDLTATTLLQPEWERIPMIGAVAQLVGGKDLTASESAYLTDQLAAQNFPVLSGGRVRDGLLRYREHLLARAKDSMRAREDTVVVEGSMFR